jgi:hypothetical protein
MPPLWRFILKSRKTSKLRSNGFAPPEKLSTFSLPITFTARAVAPALLGFRPPRLSRQLASEKSISLSSFPSLPYLLCPSQNILNRNSGSCVLTSLALCPQMGRRPAWPFSPTAVHHLFGKSTPHGLFFRLSSPKTLASS